MSEHLLDAHDFGTVFEQVRGKAVSQHVRACLALPSDFAQQIVDVVPQCAQPERLAVVAQEYVACRGGEVARFRLHLLVVADALDERFGDGDDSFLAALAKYAAEPGACVDAVPG